MTVLLLGPVARVHATMNGSCNAFVQRAALTTLHVEDSAIDAMTVEYERRRDVLIARLTTCESLTVRRPEGAFYALVGFRQDLDSALVSQELASRGVLVRPGSEFGPGGQGSIRLSFATSLEQLERAVPIIMNFFDGMATSAGTR